MTHTLLDLRDNIPTFIHISDGKLHEVNVLDILIPEAGSLYLTSRRIMFLSNALRPKADYYAHFISEEALSLNRKYLAVSS